MQCYTLSDNTSHERQWTTAVKLHPRSRMIKWSCPDCGARASYPTGACDVTIEGGYAYPDFLGCGAYPLLICSERVIAAWERHGLGPFIKFPVGVVGTLDTTLQRDEAPQYFRVEVCGEVMVDVPGSGGTFSRFCTRCGRFMTNPKIIRKFVFHQGSWDGSSIFRDHRLFPRLIFCIESVKQLFEAECFTNFRFEEMAPVVDEQSR